MANELFNQSVLLTSISDTYRLALGVPGLTGCYNMLWSAFKTFAENAFLDNEFQFKKVGIGVDPSYQLHIKNTGNQAHNIRIEALSDTKILHDISTDENGNAIYELYDYTGAKKIHINGGSSSYFLNALGIGTSTPKSNFHLNGTTGTYFQFTNTATGQASTSDGTLIGLDTNGVFEINQKENLSVKLYTNNTLRQEIESAGNVNFYENTGARKGVVWDATNQYLYLKQIGVDATSTATQKSSSALHFQTSNWNGSSEVKHSFYFRSVASTSSNEFNNLYLQYDASTIVYFNSLGAMYCKYVNATLGSGINDLYCFTLKNINDTTNNNASIGNYNANNKLISAIKFVNTSHNITTGTADMSFWGCPSGGSLTELMRLSSSGFLSFALGLSNYADDTAAAAGGVPVNGLYRNGSVVMIRVS